ncbi:phage repressor protein CI [Pantoea dispersa]|uniref:phage repressor protein CI n=1 Tax=Pantoea dispersa TaxID=59814 RepID=UPI000735F3B4|nr:phage repressor protein CI [Pantoea dispersa]KTS31440.1 phage repressor protein [Pantoea dispersa]KTS60859.1 phage repressor protein [Pantoea dispersa]
MPTKENTNRHNAKVVREAVESNRGGKDAILRLVEAYGFSSRQALCTHLGVSQSTLANRSARDTFPADWVIICHVETGASLTWLTTGKGARFMEVEESRVVIARHKKISNGVLEVMDDFILDKASLPEGLNAPFVINADRSTYLVDTYEGEIVDGLWLIEIDKLVSIRELVRFPGGRIRVENGKSSFECQSSDIVVLGKVITRTEYL